MKKQLLNVFLFMATIGLAGTKSFQCVHDSLNCVLIGGSFKLVNDTDKEVQIYTGSGFVELNPKASTSISCEVGKKIHLADKGKKKDFLFEVSEKMCGQTVKLSKYL